MNREDVTALCDAVTRCTLLLKAKAPHSDLLSAIAEAQRLETRVRSQIASLGHREGVAK
jgi:hypothetical protein